MCPCCCSLTMSWCVVLMMLALHADAEYLTSILTTEGNDVTLPFPHSKRCSRGIHICHFPLFENGSTQNGDCKSPSCLPIVFCNDGSTFEPSEEFIDRLGVKDEEHELVSDVIFNITAEDAGMYHYCPSWKVDVKQQALLVIQKTPLDPAISSKDLPVRGNVYTITCHTQSRSLPVDSGLGMNFRWKRKGEEILNNPEITISGPDLTIGNLTLEYDGVDFSCSVKERGEEWTEESPSFVISVEYGPKNVDMTLIETDDDDVITVTCSADCRPPCSLVFIQDNSTGLSGVGRIRRELTSKCDTHYSCIARNMHSTKQHTFKMCANTYAPEVKRLLANNVSRDYFLGENQTLQLYCSVIGRPEPIVTWHVALPDQSLSLLKSVSFRSAFFANVDRGIQYRYQSSYTQQEVQCAQSGRYYCTAENKRGKAEKYIDVTVKCPPTILKSTDPTQVVKLGEGLNMEMTVLSYSTPLVTCKHNYESVSRTCLLNITVTSYKGQENVTSYKAQENVTSYKAQENVTSHNARMNVTSYSAQHNVYIVQLRRNNMVEQDAGRYVVMFTNEAGVAKEKFTLIVQGASHGSTSLLPVLSGSLVSVACLICFAIVIGIYFKRRLREAKLEGDTQDPTMYKTPKSPSRLRLISKPEVCTSNA